MGAPNPADLATTESRLTALLDRYRPELVDGTIYGIPSLVWPGATGHDYFAALKRGKAKVSLYLVLVERHPDVLEQASAGLLERRTGKATFSFTALDDDLAADLQRLLDGLMERYREEHRRG